MSSYAIIMNNQVINTILAESKEIAQGCYPDAIVIEYTLENPAGIGWTYDGKELTAPVIEVPVEETPTEETPVEEVQAE